MRVNPLWLFGLGMLPMLSFAAGARVCVEAESAAVVEAPMIKVARAEAAATNKPVSGASGDVYLEIPEGSGNPPALTAGKAVLSLDIPSEGSYILWCRVYWEGECSNSFNVQIDNRPVFILGEDATFKTWHWVRYPVARTAAPIILAQGTHTFSFINREDGVRIDQVLVSADRRFVPVDTEPVGSWP